MARYIPEEKLAEIRNTSNISDIIAERVVLKKAGKDLVGLCPFHSEKTPSFTVSPLKQIFHCFGCGAGGDVFSFLMKYDGIVFFEAVQTLARRYGIELPTRDMTPTQRKIATEREQLFDLNKQIMEYFMAQLSDRSSGKNARAYLNKRGFNRDIIEKFNIGFAPDGWEHLTRFLGRNNISRSLTEKTGLVIPKKTNGFYDRFRNRVMFPISDVTRQIIGFGGRVLDDSKPKYLNSPETALYNKSRSLYGAYAAKGKSRETGCVYIVEGYFDLMALHQHGITNSVATLGTSLTPEHVKMLRRGFAQKAYLVFDSDNAGLKAAQRSISIFMNEAMDAAVIVLPKGHDPDSYIFEFGAEAFYRISEKAIGMIEFLIESAVKNNGLSMEGKVRIISEMKGPLSEINDTVARSLYVKYLAERLNVDEAAIFDKIKSSKNRFKNPRHGSHFAQQSNDVPSDRQEDSIASDMIRFERQIIAMMLKFPDIFPDIEKRRVLDYFVDKRLVAIGKLIIKSSFSDDGDLSGLMNRLEGPEQREIIASLTISDECWDKENSEKLLSQFLNTRQRRENNLLNQIKAANENDNDELVFQLLKKKQEQLANR